jgi:transposase
MDREVLAAQLADGRSIEAIARDSGRAASTVAYWVNKYGLTSSHASRHAARGGIERDRLLALVEEGLSIRAIAERLGVSYTTVRHWLARFALQTPRAKRLASTAAARAESVPEAVVDCPVHGPTRHLRRGDGGMRCLACRSDAVTRRRRTVKALLVARPAAPAASAGTRAPSRRCTSIMSIGRRSRSPSAPPV